MIDKPKEIWVDAEIEQLLRVRLDNDEHRYVPDSVIAELVEALEKALISAPATRPETPEDIIKRTFGKYHVDGKSLTDALLHDHWEERMRDSSDHEILKEAIRLAGNFSWLLGLLVSRNWRTK